MQRQETHMAEGVVYEGIGRPKSGPVEWVKQKLRERYTTKGRMEKEFRTLEKTLGPLTDQQRAEMAARIGDKIHNKVVGNVVKDALGAALVVTTGGVLIAKPELRAKLTTKLGSASMEAGQYMSKSFADAATKLRTVANEGDKVGFFKRMLAGMAEGAQKVTTVTSSRATEFFANRTMGAASKVGEKTAKLASKVLELQNRPVTSDANIANAFADKMKKVNKAWDTQKVLAEETAKKVSEPMNKMAGYIVDNDASRYAAKLAKEAAKAAKKVAVSPAKAV